MRGVQLTLVIFISVLLSYIAYLIYIGIVVASAVFILSFIYLYWILLIEYRTKYWYNRNGNTSLICPTCKNKIHRLQYQFTIQCAHCNQKVGWPGLRLLTHSVLGNQIKRTISGPLVVIVIGLLLLVVGSMGGVVDDFTVSDIEDSIDNIDIEPSTADDDVNRNQDASINVLLAEAKIVAATNTVRSKHDAKPVSTNSLLQSAARNHSIDMLKRDYFNHTTPDGETTRNRINTVKPNCRVIGENLAINYWNRNVIDQNEITTEQDLADVVVSQWMKSTGHKKNILDDSWNEIGVGIAITDSGKIYITQKFCG